MLPRILIPMFGGNPEQQGPGLLASVTPDGRALVAEAAAYFNGNLDLEAGMLVGFFSNPITITERTVLEDLAPISIGWYPGERNMDWFPTFSVTTGVSIYSISADTLRVSAEPEGHFLAGIYFSYSPAGPLLAAASLPSPIALTEGLLVNFRGLVF